MWPDGWVGELGQEETPELYVQHLVAVMGAVGRVLRDDGTLWVNLAGCYFNDPGGQNGYSVREGGHRGISEKVVEASRQVGRQKRGRHPWLKALDWVDVPGLFAHAMQEAGWYWRSDVVWVKPSALPESVSGTRWEKCKGEKVKAGATKPGYGGATKLAHPTAQYDVGRAEKAEWADCPGCPRCAATQGYVLRRGNGRPTKSTERVLLFIKRSGAYFDAEAVREPLVSDAYERTLNPQHQFGMGSGNSEEARRPIGTTNPNGRNLRDWWVLSPEPLKDEHYAAFPTALPTRCIKAGTSERGCCARCGAPWARCVERSGMMEPDRPQAKRALELAREHDLSEAHLVAVRAVGTGDVGRQLAVQKGENAEETVRLAAEAKAALGGYFREFTWPASTTLGWRPTCRCPGAADLTPAPCRVLDPFAGSGTTLIAADRLGRDAIGVELKPQYVQMAQRRVTKDAPLLMWGAVTVEGSQAAPEGDTTPSMPEAVPLLLEEPEGAAAGG